jgi:hypothetical protein
MGFTKLDERILQSSIMAEDPKTFKIWIAMLAACRENGIAYVSTTYLQAICHMTDIAVNKAIERLSSPDSASRSIADEGRRIRKVDGGFEIINYILYRDVSLKNAEAERKRLYRKKISECPDNVPTCPDSSASASASVSASPSASEIEKNLNPIDVALVQLLIELMEKNNPDSLTLRNLTEARQAEWVNQCRLLRESDNRTEAEIERVIRFSQSDSFWQKNILSMPKLRAKWDQLWMKAGRGGDAWNADAWVQGMEKRMEKTDGKN